jgi:hypothetical protein
MSEFMQHVEKQEWTQDKPTVSGWYWTYWGGRGHPEMQEVCGIDCEFAYMSGFGRPAFIPNETDGWWWLGPIALPDPPEIASN